MAYADQSVSNRRVIAIVIVAVLHAIIGYAFITGLGIKYMKQAIADLKTFDVKDEPPPPPDEPPPPPQEAPKVQPPPVVAPPPIVSPPTIQAPPMVVTPNPPPPLHIEAPAPPPPPRVSHAAAAKGDPASWLRGEVDYPSDARRDGAEGPVGVTFDINAQGRVVNCRVTQPNPYPSLNAATCQAITKRGRYTPAKDENGNPIPGGTKTLRYRWHLI